MTTRQLPKSLYGRWLDVLSDSEARVQKGPLLFFHDIFIISPCPSHRLRRCIWHHKTFVNLLT